MGLAPQLVRTRARRLSRIWLRLKCGRTTAAPSEAPDVSTRHGSRGQHVFDVNDLGRFISVLLAQERPATAEISEARRRSPKCGRPNFRILAAAFSGWDSSCVLWMAIAWSATAAPSMASPPRWVCCRTTNSGWSRRNQGFVQRGHRPYRRGNLAADSGSSRREAAGTPSAY